MPPELSIEQQQEEIIERAWAALYEASAEGQITLKSGKVVTPDDVVAWGSLLQMFRQLAALKPPKQRRAELPEDFIAKETRRIKDATDG